jgi:hypothetical protein
MTWKEIDGMRATAAVFVLGALAWTSVGPVATAQDHSAHKGAGHTAGHAMEIQTSILDGATLAKPPERVVFTFTPAMRLASVRLTTSAGERISTRMEGSDKPAGTAQVAFAPLERDTYTLTYVVDAGDHEMPGRIRFTVK